MAVMSQRRAAESAAGLWYSLLFARESERAREQEREREETKRGEQGERERRERGDGAAG